MNNNTPAGVRFKTRMNFDRCCLPALKPDRV
jgi:hypothetical protein